MANLIQVKRSTSNDAPASLVAGELAYSFLSTSNSLFIGNTGSVGGPIRIGGGKYAFLHASNTTHPGTLTPSAVVITNANSFVTNWKTNALTVGTDGATISISNISSHANSTYLGLASADGSNTELATTYAIKTYVDAKSAAASVVTTNNQILFGNNNIIGQNANFSFAVSTATLAIGNTTVNTSIAPTAITTTATIASGNTTTTGFLNVSSYGTFGGQVNATALNISGVIGTGNVNVTGYVNATGAGVFGGALSGATFSTTGTAAAGNTTITGTLSTSGNTVAAQINATSLNVSGVVGTGNVNITGTLTTSGNTVAAQVNATSLNVSGVIGTGNVNITGTLTTSGNTVAAQVNATSLNVSGVTAAGNTTVTGFVDVSSYGTFGGTVNAAALNVGANVNVNTSTITVGNTTVNTQITAGDIRLNGSQIIVGSTGTNTTITGTSVSIGSAFSVNNTAALGNTTVTGFITSSGTVNAASLNVSGAAGTGNLTVTGTTASGNTTVTGFINASSYGTFGGQVNAIALNISGLVATGNTTTTGFINASSYGTFGGVVNATSFNSTGTATSTFANNVTITGTANVVAINVSGDATVAGNLYVTGSLVSINVATLSIKDSLIQLASNNYLTPDILDIGLYGNYGGDAANTANTRHTGFFRDASDAKWKLFDNLLAGPDTTVDTGAGTFRYATLQGQLSAGGADATGFIANSTTIAITANATLNVALIANTLTLSTALAGGSGGTGLASFTTEDLLVANSSNGFRKLNVGSDGYVLQVASGAVSWNTLDGGAF